MHFVTQMGCGTLDGKLALNCSLDMECVNRQYAEIQRPSSLVYGSKLTVKQSATITALKIR